jgi:hypothetical protein
MMQYRHSLLILILTGIVTGLNAHVDTPRTFRNNANKKMRLTLWYKRYEYVDGTIRYENRIRKYTTHIKPGRSIKVTLRATFFDDLEFCYLMATNTRRRNEWAALLYKDLQKTNDFTIAYDGSKSLTITPSPRNIS